MPEICGYTGAQKTTRVAVYLPAAGSKRASVLLVPTIGDERRSLVRVEVELARSLAEASFLSIRFDPSADPDSPLRPEDRTIEALKADLSNAMSLFESAWGGAEGGKDEPAVAPAPKAYVVALRAGAVLLASASIAGSQPAAGGTLAGAVLIAPVSGEEFVRGLSQRQQLRRMLSEKAASEETQDAGAASGLVDIDGVPYRRDFLAAFAEERQPEATRLRLAALQVGPARDVTSSTRRALGPWLKAGARLSLPAQLPAGVNTATEPAVAIWRHPVLWGQTEYRDASALIRFVTTTLESWEMGRGAADEART